MTLPADIEEKYEVLGQLGAGGMGAVYQARHRLLDEMRVIKVMQPHYATSERSRERFHREAKAAIRLRHPNIAQVHDFSVDRDGVACLIMEFIDGFTLKHLLRSGPPPMDLALEIALQSLEAMEYLHGQGYLHRDIAPDNLMLTRRLDGRTLVKLIDLGLAKEVGSGGGLTVTGTFVGKVRYASPEQFRRADEEAGPRSDLYSFGVVLYELLTGVCPIKGESFEEIIASHLLDPIPPFEKTDPEGRIPDEVREGLLGVLAKRPPDRLPSASALSALLRPCHQSPAPLFADVLERYGQAVNLLGGGNKKRLAKTVVWQGSSSKDGAGSAGQKGLTVQTELASQKKPKLGASLQDARSPRRSHSPSWRKWGLVALLMAVLFVGVGLLRQSPPLVDGEQAVSEGEILLDARPWAEVTSVVDALGQAQEWSGGSYTPLRLNLQPGSYQVVFDHPDLTSPRVESVEVKASEVSTRNLDLGVLDADAYFEMVGLRDDLARAGS